MDGLAIGSLHDATLGKAKSLLIKGRASRYIGDCKHGRYGAVLFLVEGINLLCHSAPFRKPRQFSRADSAGPDIQQMLARKLPPPALLRMFLGFVWLRLPLATP